MKWEHDGRDMSTAPRLAGDPHGDFDWGKIRHRHVMVMDGPRVRNGLDDVPVAVGGRHCARRGCSERDPRPTCVEQVADGWAGHRCFRVGIALRDKPYWPGEDHPCNPPRTEGPDGSGWWYCATHDPVARLAKADAGDAERRAKRAVADEQHESRSALITEARRWRDDELATEGFCADGEPCEHHECRLARAVARYEAAHGITQPVGRGR